MIKIPKFIRSALRADRGRLQACRDRILEKLITIWRCFALTYGSFTGGLLGALLGAGGTVLAGSWAWDGVQQQINQQSASNDYAMLAILKSERDRLVTSRHLLGEAQRVFAEVEVELLTMSYSSKDQADIEIGSKYRDSLNSLKNMPIQAEEETRKGGAGMRGYEFYAIMKNFRTTIQSLLLCDGMLSRPRVLDSIRRRCELEIRDNKANLEEIRTRMKSASISYDKQEIQEAQDINNIEQKIFDLTNKIIDQN